MTARAFLDGLFRTAIAAAHPSSCLPPHLPPAARVRPADRAGRRQGRRRHDRGRRSGTISTAPVFRPEPPHRARRDAPRLWPADPASSDDRGRSSDARCRGLAAAERALALADARRRGRSRAGAAVGRRVRQLDRAGDGAYARRQAGGDARAAALGRQHRRDQHGAKASLPHQGRTARAARAAGARPDARDLRRAGRRSGGDRLGSDRARSRPRSPTPARSSRATGSNCPTSVTRALADPRQRNAEARRSSFCGAPNSS